MYRDMSNDIIIIIIKIPRQHKRNLALSVFFGLAIFLHALTPNSITAREETRRDSLTVREVLNCSSCSCVMSSVCPFVALLKAILVCRKFAHCFVLSKLRIKTSKTEMTASVQGNKSKTHKRLT